MHAITALLGPTNTGKTHRAVERMLEHATGMIGLPLRLLAREVYDRITARVGESKVALVTGEEQRIPPRPAYWVATVEAMPVDREVEFLAVDEIQLAAHDQRGHVFTSRLLSARGTKETWFMGAGTMRGIVSELVPTAHVVEHPRLSRLTYAGSTPLAQTRPRSAVVAFSIPHVYEIAERIRARKGGAAVVLGALSPRTRNAQVAMFQAGEVDWLVATDAIGMGLNLDVDHVAFAALRKFDGREVRDVADAELGQIAGRAGRWVKDGTFGAMTPLEVPSAVAHAIELHRFDAVRRVRYRNDDLSFASIGALRESLHAPSPRRILVPVRDAEDAIVFDALTRKDDVLRAARGEEAVRLLWDVCTVPDFRKLLLEVHVDFLQSLFLELVARGRLDDDWVDRHVRELGGEGGDVETLVARIAAVRTWTYVSNRSTWLVSPAEWQERTRALEDRLSDELHARLVTRFVEAKKGSPKRPRGPGLRGSERAREDDDDDAPVGVAPGHPFAKLAAMRAVVKGGPPEKARATNDVSRDEQWVQDLVEAPHDAFVLDDGGTIRHVETGRALASVARGTSIGRPVVKLVDVDTMGGGAQRRLHRRLLAFAHDVVSELLGDVREVALASATAEIEAATRGLLFRLEHGLGTVLTRDVHDVIAILDEPTRRALAAAGLTIGRSVVYAGSGLSPRAIGARIALARVWFGAGRALVPPQGGAVSFVYGRGVTRAAYTAIGFPVFGPRAIRADILSRLEARLDDDAERAPTEAEIATWLGCPTRDVRAILRELTAPGAVP